MALQAKHNNIEFGVGDRIKITQIIKEGEKERLQVFDGIVIKIRGRGVNKTFTVRSIGSAQIGIEKIYPLNSPVIKKIEVAREGVRGAKRAKLYYIREKSRKQIEKIYSRSKKRSLAKLNNAPKK